MKRLLVLSLALCLLLAGCDYLGGGSEDGGTPPGSPASGPQTAKPDTAVSYEASYLDGGSGNETGYYHIAAAKASDGTERPYGNLFYIDYASRQQVYLCNKPNCSHGDETCSSYLDGYAESDYQILATDSALYLLYDPAFGISAAFGDGGAKSAGRAAAPAIYRMQLDGTGRTKLLELESGLRIAGPYIYGGGKLFCSGAKTQVKNHGNGLFASESGEQMLMEFDLEHKTSRVVTSIAYDQIIGAYGNTIILCRYQFPIDPKTLLGNDSAYMENFRKATGKLVFLDPVSGTEDAFYEASSNDVAGMTQWQNHIYFSSGNSTIRCLQLDTRKVTTVTDRLPAGKCYVSCEYGALLCTYYDNKPVNAAVLSCSQIDPETGAIAPMSLFIRKPYGPIRILDEHDGYYLVISDYRYKEENTWAGTNQIAIQGAVYALIAKSDYQASKPNYLAIQAVK